MGISLFWEFPYLYCQLHLQNIDSRIQRYLWIFNNLAILNNLRNIIKFGILYIDNRSYTIPKHLYIISVLSEVLFVVINFACSKFIYYTISELFVKVFILQSIFLFSSRKSLSRYFMRFLILEFIQGLEQNFKSFFVIFLVGT